MKKVILLVLIVLCFASAKTYATSLFLQEQEFVSHHVKKGETIYSISKTYGVSEDEIYKMNPDAKSSIYEGLVLVLPNSSRSIIKTTSNDKVIKFITHKVKRKETLYSLSKVYDLPIEVIKQNNPQLYSKSLRKGDEIKIPTNYKEVVVEKEKDLGNEMIKNEGVISEAEETHSISPIEMASTATEEYIVKVKETKYGIAKRYGISILQLEKINPDLGDALSEGTIIQVPIVKNNNEPQFYLYEVKKGNTMYSLLKQFNINEEDLIALNPDLADGLKVGMILKVSKNSSNLRGIDANEYQNKVNLIDSITNYSVKNIAVMLPFGINRASVDTANVRKDLLKSDRVLRLALDFHSGVLMAVEDAEKKGITTNVVVYDTEYDRKNGKATNARKIENIITENDFSNVDAVIGPLLGGNVDRAARLLEDDNIPVISPITQKISGGPNVFQSRPSDDLLRARMFEYLEIQDKEMNVVIIADFKNSETKSRLKKIFPNAKEVFPREGDNGMFLRSEDISSKVLDSIPNLVVLDTNDIPMISQVTTDLNALVSGTLEEDVLVKRDITLFTTYKGRAYDSDEIQHTHLMNLNFHFPSMYKEFDNSNMAFVEAYKARYSITPSTEAIRGYDIMMDTLLRLGYGEDMYGAVSSEITTEYVENKFNYEKTAMGYNNTAVYIIKYGQDLLLEEVKIIKAQDKESEE